MYQIQVHRKDKWESAICLSGFSVDSYTTLKEAKDTLTHWLKTSRTSQYRIVDIYTEEVVHQANQKEAPTPTTPDYEIQVLIDGTWARPKYTAFDCVVPTGSASAVWHHSAGTHEQHLNAANVFCANNPGVLVRLVQGTIVHWQSNMEVHMNTTPELAKPLNIDRKALIARLNIRHREEVQKRETAEADRRKEREEILEAIEAFTTDELYNILRNNYTIKLADLKYAKEAKTYVTADVKPTAEETATEKFVRVLEMAADDTVEVIPTDDLYGLL